MNIIKDNQQNNQQNNKNTNKHTNKLTIFKLIESLKTFLSKNCIFLAFNKNLIYHIIYVFLVFTSIMQIFIFKYFIFFCTKLKHIFSKYVFSRYIFNKGRFNKYLILLKSFGFINFLNSKKLLLTILSYIIIYSQITFSFIITQSVAQSIISIISIKRAYAFNEIVPPQNLQDNPINHITPDNSINIPGTNSNTHLDRTQNGTPVVNINNANADGISANYYKDFNVNEQNLILNNHKGESVNTQLGGVVYGNPNFNNSNGREADIILNEVTTNRVSNINGYMEVAGKRADVIIANPNGIMVGGAGFINTNRLSMITGKSIDGTTNSSFNQNGELNPFLLTDTNKNPNAIIQVVGRNITDSQGRNIAYNLGIDAQDVRYADLVSRVVKINGNIHGGDGKNNKNNISTEVNIKTGNDRAEYNKKDGFKINSRETKDQSKNTINDPQDTDSTEEATKPEFAIDSTAFGGIYAGRINFIATEEGVGVRTRSDLVASTDDLNFDVNGNIILEEEGSLYAKNNINLNNKNNNSSESNNQNTNRQIVNNSYIVSENNININTNEFINSDANANTNPNIKKPLVFAANNINIQADIADNSNTLIETNTNNNETDINNNKTDTNNNNNNNSNYSGIISNNGTINLNISNTLNNNNGNILGKNVNIKYISPIDKKSTAQQQFQIQTKSQTQKLSDKSINQTIVQSTTQTADQTTAPSLPISNYGGNIVSNDDITIDILADYIITGTIFSKNGNVDINAKDIINLSDVIGGNNITFTSNNGNIYNGSETNSNANIIAMNDVIFNILKQENDTGNLYNYGKISAGNNIEINAEDSVYNGLATGSNATITANNSLTITANNRIINKGYIQATGLTDQTTSKKIDGTGNLTLTTKAEINSDYELGNNTANANANTNTNLDDLNNKINGNEDKTLSPEVQSKFDNLNSITDTNELYDLIPQLKTEEQYYLVQNRIRILAIKETLNDLDELYTFNEEDWKDKSDEEIKEQLQGIFGNNYDEELDNSINGAYSNYLSQRETEIDNLIEQQLIRKQEAEDNSEEFNETLLDKNKLMAEAETEANAKKLEKIKDEMDSEKSKVNRYLTDLNNSNWDSLTNGQINENLQDILNNNYIAQNWSIPEYQAVDNITPITNEYLGSLRINDKDLNDQNKKNKMEQTGIHNYGRIYSNNDMELNSNSVLHNNKGALIYSNNNINFNINKVLFNNENALGQGIFANNDINIRGYCDKNDTACQTNIDKYSQHPSLEKLINYDGRIEANNNIDIKSNEVINYGSDSIDLSKVDTEIKPIYDYYYTTKSGFRTKKTYITKEEYESRIASGNNKDNYGRTITLGKTFKWYGVEETPELLQAYGTNYNFIQNAGLYQTVLKAYDTAYSKVISNESVIQSNNGNINIKANNTTNYNSVLFSKNDMAIDTKNLLNKNLEFNVNANQYYQYHGKKKKWTGHAKEYYDEWTSHVVLNIKGSKTAKILAGNDLVISANAIGNGTAQSNSDYSNNSNRLPYTQQTTPQTTIEDLLSSGILNPLDSTQLPQGNYGIFRQPQNPNSNYLFETDPTLIDTNRFLGSKYFMNRLGLDPDTIDLKFLGDSYFEHELIRKAIEQQSLSTNTHLDPQQIKQQIDNLYNSMTQEKAQQLNLTIGEPLTEQQRAQLTEDTIWYVKQEVQLPNGETIESLVPQIFYCNTTLARLEQERILNTAGSMLAGTNVILQTKPNSTDNINNTDNTDDTIFNTILSNSGTITAKNTLAITGFDTISNVTSSIRNDDINALSQDKFNNQATLTAGNTLIIDTGVNGTVNNLSGMIALNNTNDNTSSTQNSLYDNLLYINTGTLNNITLSQQETVEKQTHSKKNDYEFSKTSTYIGDTAAIQSSNNNSNIIINANEDINILGGDIKTTIKEQDNSNIVLNAGNNINIAAIQDYEYQRQYMRRKGGTFGETLTKENIDQSVTNIQSNISAGNNLSIATGNDLNSIGTNFTANNGDIDLNIKNDLNLYNAMDYVYDYDYTKRESFDLASAIVNVASAVAVGALTGGAGAAVMAGISATSNVAGMTKGSIDIETNYDETIVANNITGNNININTNNSLNSISTKMNTENTINYNIGGNSFISEAQERHEYKITHDEFGGNIGRAVLGGAITGAMSGLGLNGGKYLGNLASSSITDGILNASINGAVLTSVNAYSSSIGSAMSQTILNGGSFKDVLKAGRDSSISRNTLMNTMIGAVIGATGGALGKVIKDVKAKYNSSLTQEQIQNKMTEIPVGESNLKIGNLNNNKVGINSYIKDGKIIQAGTPNINVNYFTSNQNIFFKAFNFLPGSPSFADFHDALNISGIWNQLSIPYAYMISQFNALYPYYPSLIYFNNTKENK